MRVIHNKLVRDRIPELIEHDGKICVVSQLGHDDYVRELKRKLLEEAQEAGAASGLAELTIELADLLEVMVSLCKATGISMNAVEDTRALRAEERGRFERRLFLENVVSEVS
jgi:predicted house-cleaning noncanonical NTP pyrophosphatase (MazG superfamily)